jgi:tetratricopeptide (TPR) repeat protein
VNPLTAHRLPLTLLLLLLVLPAKVRGQGESLTRAFDLERRGSFAQAADLYRSVLATKPGEVSALLGLERSLVPLNRLPEILPQVRAALAANPQAAPVYGVALRAYSAANQLDSLHSAVEQWAKVSPGDETPFREWGAAALARHDRSTARKAYTMGREKLGRPDALAAEVAQLAVMDEDWSGAAREWARATKAMPGYRPSAINTLSEAPRKAHDDILKQLDREDSPEATRLAVALRARWGDPLGAFNSLMENLPEASGQAIEALQQFLEQARTRSTPDAYKAQGKALEELAERWAGAPQKARFRLDAARAYASAGDRASARRMLTMIAEDPVNAPTVTAGASATLIGLLVDEGKLDEASKRLEEYRSVLPVDEYQQLRRDIALGYGRTGTPDRGLALLATDSTVEGMAAVGRIQLYRGDLKGASDAFRAAGPFAGSRTQATERASLLAVLQPIEAESLPALGSAFAKLDTGDSVHAAAAFEKLAADLPPTGGGAELRLLAGRIQAAQKQPVAAEQSFRAAIVKDAPATAAAASLELGRLLMDLERDSEAAIMLERMILDYPTSALVPQARRLLDQARGATPKT